MIVGVADFTGWRPHKLAKLTRNIVGDRLDILVANAGVSKSATIEDTTIEDFDRLFAVNVRAPFFLVQHRFRFCRRVAASFCFRRWGRVALSARSRHTQQPRALLTRW